jgi:hypothetical protein
LGGETRSIFRSWEILPPLTLSGFAAPSLARFCDICLLNLYCLRLDYASKPGACQWACGFFFLEIK